MASTTKSCSTLLLVQSNITTLNVGEY